MSPNVFEHKLRSKKRITVFKAKLEVQAQYDSQNVYLQVHICTLSYRKCFVRKTNQL